MTKIAIISDIHSNKEALYAVLSDMEKRGVDKIVCLGDIVTKYVYPREVVEALKSSCEIIVRGNCDQNVVENENYRYARNKLGLENIEFLAQLPLVEQLKYKDLLLHFFHATPYANDQIFNPVQTNSYHNMFIGEQPQINFFGHTHIPSISLISPHGITLTTESSVYLKTNGKYILNVGSVGEPLIVNPNPLSANKYLVSENMNYMIFTDENGIYQVQKISVPYKNIFVKVYVDFVHKQQLDKQGNRYYPRSPKDTTKLYESLNFMGVTDIPMPDDIDKNNSYTR